MQLYFAVVVVSMLDHPRNGSPGHLGTQLTFAIDTLSVHVPQPEAVQTGIAPFVLSWADIREKKKFKGTNEAAGLIL